MNITDYGRFIVRILIQEYHKNTIFLRWTNIGKWYKKEDIQQENNTYFMNHKNWEITYLNSVLAKLITLISLLNK